MPAVEGVRGKCKNIFIAVTGIISNQFLNHVPLKDRK
jgi:hypothetical protein